MDQSFQSISDKIQHYLTQRGWENNPPRGLAISIALEANELLEHYQWQDTPVGTDAEIAEELADIFMYAFQFAAVHGIDIPAAIESKLLKVAQKYPAERYNNKNKEEQKSAWLEDKLSHQKKGL